jgi:hypothetical protein
LRLEIDRVRAHNPDAMNNIERYRKQAEEARQGAQRAVSQVDKEAWLQIAAEFTKLAKEAERRENDPQTP